MISITGITKRAMDTSSAAEVVVVVVVVVVVEVDVIFLCLSFIYRWFSLLER